jgi:hypothetical protein
VSLREYAASPFFWLCVAAFANAVVGFFNTVLIFRVRQRVDNPWSR